MDVSIVIRTYNEVKHLPQLLSGIRDQEIPGISCETILVDSGSNDGTVDVATSYGCRVLTIRKSDFTFGRSLNLGCQAATGRYLVFVSGHCVPANSRWLMELISPLTEGIADYVYGKQIGNGDSRFSECQIFKKYFPDVSSVPQNSFFCNNANAALQKHVWKSHRFNEDLTGLEDMELAKRLISAGLKIGYISTAPVYHLHEESWAKVRNRFEREAVALQHIMPEIQISVADMLRYIASSILMDLGYAVQQRDFSKRLGEIILYRCSQYWGSYRGNHFHRRLSRERKERYFYPR